MSLSKQISLPVLYFLILFFLSFSISHSKLLFLFEHCRHGARSMSHLDKNDKDFIGELWNGKAELSYVGMRQHYLLGVNNKYKYSELLNFSEYNPNDIIVYATNSNRTIMSAQSQLIGMYGSNSSMEKLDDKQKEMATLPFKITDDNILNRIKELNLMKWSLKTISYLSSAHLQTFMKEFGLAKVQARKFLNFVTTHLGKDVNVDEKESTNESSIFKNIKLV